MNSLLHIYSQMMQHTEAYIVGNKEGLEALRGAIDTALLHSSGDGKVDAFVGDGEGFTCYIARLVDKDFDTLAVPYTESYARENREIVISPWELWRHERDGLLIRFIGPHP